MHSPTLTIFYCVSLQDALTELQELLGVRNTHISVCIDN